MGGRNENRVVKMMEQRSRLASLGLALALALVFAGDSAIAASKKSKSRRSRASSQSRSKKKAGKKAKRPSLKIASLSLYPEDIQLVGAGAGQHFVVTASLKDGNTQDVTDIAKIAVGNRKVAKVAGNVVSGLSEGRTQLTITMSGKKVFTWVTISQLDLEPEISFVNDVMPVLTKSGCNASACHGAPPGKGGLKFSLFGYEPKDDAQTLTEGADGKRVNLDDPKQSLLLQKPTASVPHGGGQRFEVDSAEYKTLLAWLQNGAQGPADIEPTIERLEVYPGEAWLPTPKSTQRLVVTAHFSDGSKRDVTEKSVYVSNEDTVATADETGLVQGEQTGETAVMLRFLGRVAVSRVAVLPDWKQPRYPKLPQNNFIDEIIDVKLKKLRITPSANIDDAAFIRRVYLDVLGLTPPPEDVKKFMADSRKEKRATLIDELLLRPEHADLWAMKWGDTLRNNPRLTRQGLLPYHLWLRQQVADNVPYDQFTRSLLTALGKNAPENDEDTDYNPAANYFVVSRNPLDIASATSQIFLGVRMECARCHNHPFEKWTMNDYYGYAAFFGGVQARGRGNQMPRTVVLLNQNVNPRNPRARRLRTRVRNPVTGRPAVPKPLDGDEISPENLNRDVRVNMVDWMTAPENPYFAKNMVNRLWEHYFGRGIVDPVDDFRVTNPASNPELLDALAKEFIDKGFDLRHMHRLMVNSRTYQVSSRPNEYNRNDRGNFARYYPKRLSAEQLFDSISQATGIFLPIGGRGGRRGIAGRYLRGMKTPITRAMQFPAPRAPGEMGRFLDIFGKPAREEICSCERSSEGNMAQALALLNSNVVNNKISSQAGRVRKVFEAIDEMDEQIRELFLATLSRPPTPIEVEEASILVRSSEERRKGLEDLMWSLLNTREFMFNH